eukprot:PhF_6_TR7062/c0_g1_i2/m.10662/K16600/TTLL2; tubulin polyglutamylase TTLL2
MDKIVRYEQGRGAPPIIRRVLEDLGWVEYDEEGPPDQTLPNLYWKTARFHPSDMAKANERYLSMRLNHFPRSGCITKKDNLHRNLRRLRVSCGGGPMFDFAPVTFVLPNEYVKFCKALAEVQENEPPETCVWICKPSDLSRGRKIFVFRDIGQLSYDCASVVQRYIYNPLLLDGYKFDFRIYVLVTSFQPLRAYIYRDCLGRFSTEKYDLSKLDDVFRHLTNYSINREAPNVSTNKGNVGTGCKWDVDKLRAMFAEKGVDFNDLFARIDNVVMLTLLSICNDVPENTSCFELFGFDIIFDENFKAWVLEVNFSPALAVESEVDEKVKYPLIADMIETLNIQPHEATASNTTTTASPAPPPKSSLPPLPGRRRSDTLRSACDAAKQPGITKVVSQRSMSSSSRKSIVPPPSVPVPPMTGPGRVFTDKPAGKFEMIFPFNPETEKASHQMVHAQHQEKDKVMKFIIAEVKK